jgi:hypothetical protein
MNNLILIGKTTTGKTFRHFETSQEYPDSSNLLIYAQLHFDNMLANARQQLLELNIDMGILNRVALCSEQFLEENNAPPTHSPESDIRIDIVDDQVVILPST